MSANSNNRDDDRKSDLAVMDVNEYKQKRRLQRILDAHDRVEDIDNDAWMSYIEGGVSAEAKNITLQKAVKKAIRESYNLLNEYANQNGDTDPYWHGEADEPIGKIQRERGEDIVIDGLRDFLATEKIYEETWEEPTEQRHGPDETVTQHETYTVPERVSWNAFLRLKEFLSQQHDLEVRFEDLELDIDADPF